VWLLDHAQRTWYYAAAFNTVSDLHVDLELLYCASLLHDFGSHWSVRSNARGTVLRGLGRTWSSPPR
jgi:HD superfamily phosphodiesterase